MHQNVFVFFSFVLDLNCHNELSTVANLTLHGNLASISLNETPSEGYAVAKSPFLRQSRLHPE